MSPEHMKAYREGKEAFNTGARCPYIGWRAGAWEVGWLSAKKYNEELIFGLDYASPVSCCLTCGRPLEPQ
jgi:hypothetical protein